jgi:hypothetical protein
MILVASLSYWGQFPDPKIALWRRPEVSVGSSKASTSMSARHSQESTRTLKTATECTYLNGDHDARLERQKTDFCASERVFTRQQCRTGHDQEGKELSHRQRRSIHCWLARLLQRILSQIPPERHRRSEPLDLADLQRQSRNNAGIVTMSKLIHKMY